MGKKKRIKQLRHNPSLKINDNKPPIFLYKFDDFLRKKIYVFLILLVLGSVWYANVINGPFLFDDDNMIVMNTNLRSFNNIPKIFSSSITSGAYLSGGNFYRPLQVLIHTIIFQIFELNSSAYHIVSILIHIINSFLLFLFAKKILQSRVSSFFASIFFLTHPIQTEAVSYISGLSDPLALTFILSGLLFFIKSIDVEQAMTKNKFFVITIIFFIFAIFSKETSVVFFLLLSIVMYFYKDKLVKEMQISSVVKKIAFFILLTSFYLFIKFTAFNFTGNVGLTYQNNIYTENLHVRLITFINVLWDYVKLIFYPVDLNYEKPYRAYLDLFTSRGIFGLLLIGSGLTGVYYSLRKNKIFFLNFCWVFICLLPVSGIIPVNAIFLEHWLYMPMIGISIGFASLYDCLKFNNHKKIYISVFILIFFLFGVRTILRNSQWADSVKFYENEIKYTKKSGRIHNNLAMVYSKQKKYKLAIKNYKKAIEIYDIYPTTHNNLALTFQHTGQIDKAINEFFIALKMNPNFLYSHVNLYKLFLKIGNKKMTDRFIKNIQYIERGGLITYENVIDCEQLLFSP